MTVTNKNWSPNEIVIICVAFSSQDSVISHLYKKQRFNTPKYYFIHGFIRTWNLVSHHEERTVWRDAEGRVHKREHLEMVEVTGSCKDCILRCEHLDPHLLDYNSTQHCTAGGHQHCEGTYYLNRWKNMGSKCQQPNMRLQRFILQDQNQQKQYEKLTLCIHHTYY